MPTLSVVVPCYNEADGIDQLRSRLLPVLERLASRYAIELILIDDGSTDATFERLNKAFGELSFARVVRHPRNLNVGGAIRTGARESRGEWIANLDSDCTYDPAILEPMLRQMEEGADLVTASPYHPNGGILGVPPYRLFLSKAASGLYRLILRTHIHTFTAMVRVYRREIYGRIASPESDFAAIAEMMLKAIKQSLQTVEVPAVLSVRRFGQSKLRVARVIASHLKLMIRLIVAPRSFSG
jgi:dolichol-phosphate mannosyltransferase